MRLQGHPSLVPQSRLGVGVPFLGLVGGGSDRRDPDPTELGRVGMTAVGATADEAAERYADAETRLRDEARVALEPHTIG